MEINELSVEELEKLLSQKKEEEKLNLLKRREAYESIRAQTVNEIMSRVLNVANQVKELHHFVISETNAFREVMQDYGELKRNNQMSFRIQHGDYRIEVKSCKVKKFDERADVAASRLIDFLKKWISNREQGSKDPMYQLAMTLLERNKYGDLDYKSISKLYDLEAQFNNEEYSEIMRLFKESNVVEGTRLNFYFYEKNKLGVWNKIEPSFNML